MDQQFTTYEKFLLRSMLRQRLSLYEDLQQSIETLALEGGPEERVLGESCSSVVAIRDQKADLERLYHKLV